MLKKHSEIFLALTRVFAYTYSAYELTPEQQRMRDSLETKDVANAWNAIIDSYRGLFEYEKEHRDLICSVKESPKTDRQHFLKEYHFRISSAVSYQRNLFDLIDSILNLNSDDEEHALDASTVLMAFFIDRCGELNDGHFIFPRILAVMQYDK